MKKLLIILLALILALSMFSCGKKNAQMENPWEEGTKQFLYDELGYAFDLPEDGTVTDVHYLWSTPLQIGEVQFTYNGKQWSARAKRARDFEDITGAYYGWTFEEGVDIGNGIIGQYRMFKDKSDTFTVFTWFSPIIGYNVSLSADSEVVGVVDFPPLSFFGVGEDTSVNVDENVHDYFYWAKKFNVELSEFTITVEKEASKLNFIHEGDLFSWTNSEFNTEGWHYYTDGAGRILNNAVYNRDNTYMILNPEPLKKGAVYEAVPCESEVVYEDTEFGRVYSINSCTPIGKLNGINLMGNMLTQNNYDNISLTQLRYSFLTKEKISLYFYDDNTFENWIGNVLVYTFAARDSLDEYGERISDGMKSDAIIYDIVDKEGLRVSEFSFQDPGEYDLVFAYNGYVTHAVRIIVEDPQPAVIPE
ncbi:MAG: hypothetical protein MJ171_02745 [Clostridia bacterium]|nr:hypothetical protein [Clostridia bacterium]